jgi:hypothetical protein
MVYSRNMSSVTYPLSRSDLYNMMGPELQTRIAVQIEEISAAIIAAATAGQGNVDYNASSDILDFAVSGVRERFPDCNIFYTSSSSITIVWLR